MTLKKLQTVGFKMSPWEGIEWVTDRQEAGKYKVSPNDLYKQK